MIHWIAGHSAGWELLLPCVILCAIGLEILFRTGRKGLTPWVIGPSYGLAYFLYYHTMGIDRFWYYARDRWWVLVTVLASTSSFLSPSWDSSRSGKRSDDSRP